MTADLVLSCGKSLFIAPVLKFEMRLYEGAIMRVAINEKEVNSKRFKLTDHEMGAIIQGPDVLIPVQDLENVIKILDSMILIRILDNSSSDDPEYAQYVIKFSPFRIEQIVNGMTTVIVNENDNLYFEDFSAFRQNATT